VASDFWISFVFDGLDFKLDCFVKASDLRDIFLRWVMRFVELEWAAAIPAALIMLWLAWRHALSRQRRLIRFVGPIRWNKTQGKGFSSLSKRALGIFVVIFILWSLAWLRPQVPEGAREIKSEGIELLLLADVSWSMMAEDVGPSRLERMKLDMMRLTERLTGHQVGLVAFAGSATLMSPFTQDLSAVRLYVDSLAPTTVSHQGTNFAEALALAKETFAENRKKRSSESHVTQAILILSDGEDHEPGLEKAVEALLQEKVRVFAFGYGTEAGGKIPERDSLGFLKGYRKNRKGEEIISKFTGSTLEKIVKAGEGDLYFPAFDTHAIENFAKSLEFLNKAEFESLSVVDYSERFQIFLLGGLLIWLSLLVYQVWVWYNPKKLIGLRAGKIPGLPGVLILLSLALAYPEPSVGLFDLKTWAELRKVHQLIEAGEIESARVRLSQERPKLEGSLREIYLGYLFLLDKDVPNALKAFAHADRLAQNNEEQFLSRFNQGFILQITKQYEKALEAYQKALEVRPDSMETKINIELLIQQMQSKGEGGASENQNDDAKNPDQDQDQDQEQPKAFRENPRQQFQSEKLTPQDVQRIMRELQDQERRIRSEFTRQKGKQKANEKDW
jgi:Ca-activated chloride channel family protein